VDRVRGKNLIWASILTVVIIGAALAVTARAAPQTKLSVEPGSLGMYNAGETFSVDIVVQNVVGLNAYDFKLSWDPFIIKPIDIDQGPFLSQDGTYSTFFLYKIEMTYDRCLIGEMMLGPTTTSGNGILATITFKVVGAGNCPIDLYESKLLDINVVNMAHGEFDGHVSGHMIAEISSCWPEASLASVEDEDFGLHVEVENIGDAGPVYAYCDFIGFDIMGNMFVLPTEKVVIPQGESRTMGSSFDATYYGIGTYRLICRCYFSYDEVPPTPMDLFVGSKEKHLKFQVR
jgi:hypothetical protein